MYHPTKLDVSGGGQVLDLETAVKDGILGGDACGPVYTGVADKLDLKKMMQELESIDVPSVGFLWVITLALLPMQELWDDSVTPNKTLQQLIYAWFSRKYVAKKKKSEDVQGRTVEILETLKKVKGQARVQALKELRQVVTAHSTAKKAVVVNNGVGLISLLLGPFTSHAVGSEAIGILVNLDLDMASKKNLMQPAKISLMVDMLNEGTIETKVNCTRLIEVLIEANDFGSEKVSSLSLLVGLLRLVKDKRHQNGVLAGLGLLKTICSHESVRNSLVSIGAVPQLVDILPSLSNECLEFALYVLEILSTVPEGRLALKDCPNTIPNVVKLLMRVSESCTQFALSILSTVCKLAPDECASLAVDAGLAAKLLLVIQSGCSPVLKQRSAELLKLCSLNYSATIFLSKCASGIEQSSKLSSLGFLSCFNQQEHSVKYVFVMSLVEVGYENAGKSAPLPMYFHL
ncbi:hypothetical protein Patl1_08793 [Pistacia atlantica]|uniref:Uncharacterized protein n=1 Tax=Pistacia atlantica TaxID=434234 RepID=A0ACC1AGX3_9ROSI|nr:hypothetical protein Patl1_08793 [Pistacia atlantica]